MKIQYSRDSINDLIRLRKFIEDKNPYAANRAASNILNGIEKLKNFPEIGLLVQRAPDPEKLRDLFVSNYIVRYLIGHETIYVLRIWHGKEIEKDL